MASNAQVSTFPLIKAWLASFSRYSIGVIPLGNAAWLVERVSPSEGTLVLPTSRLLPIGRLFLVPTSLEPELFRRARKSRRLVAVTLPLVSMSALVFPLGQDMGGRAQNATTFVSLLLSAILLAMAGPLLVFAFHFQRFLKTRMKRVRPVPNVALGFFFFGLAIWALFVLHKFLAEYISVGPASNRKNNLGSESFEVAGEVLQEFLSKPHSSILSIILTLLKTAAGFLVVLFGTVFSLEGAVIISREFDDDALMLAVPIMAIVSFVISYRYLVSSERKHRKAFPGAAESVRTVR